MNWSCLRQVGRPRDWLGEYERGGGLEDGAEQMGGANGFESQGPPGFIARADLGEFHRALRLSRACRDLLIVQGEPADLPRFGYRPPARWVTRRLPDNRGNFMPLG